MSITQTQRAKIIAKSYEKWDLRGKRVLDVGCGNGVVSQILKEELDLDLYGTDIIDYCKTEIPFRKMSQNHKLPFDSLFFDYVMFNDVLHHSEDSVMESLLTEGKRVGKCIVIVEDREMFFLDVLDRMINYFYSSKMPCPANFKSRKEWLSFFSKFGFCCEDGDITYPFWYPIRHMVFKLTKIADG